MAKAKRRRAKKREAVRRAERVAATPETLAKLRPCPLKAMLERGEMEHEQYEAALQIWDAHDTLVRHLKVSPKWMIERSDKSTSEDPVSLRDHLVMIYIVWSGDIAQRYHLVADHIVEWIDDSDPARRIVNEAQKLMLVKACDTWIAVSDTYHARRRAERRVAEACMAA